ncbi:hypothetical protein KKJ01_21300 [Xenorhabdus bovienii]|uniref:Uncharacterized protein n=2 Tax=Xenorhabdus bovienii TaxID=40576 RepID=A0AAJ1JC30_XENBV|nr:hypothetical protein [Xenorhabdus bovienii]MDE1480651.1 hypothetical protein [Xenorhabdus bovienii]MDE1492487.1 hypothetical protein [Xenorhabdus bovienii]MDE9512372.1 hypothetical protein [Xenorhabdus bovienii]MDE9524008.1 hypothetical protein [Xenorhabdus bovienii]
MEKRIEELERKVAGLEKQLAELQGAVSHYHAIHQIAIDELKVSPSSASYNVVAGVSYQN